MLRSKPANILSKQFSRLIVSLFLGAVLIALGAENCGAAAKENLMEESELPAIYDNTIMQFWTRVGNRRDFAGVRGDRISSMVFSHPNSDVGIVIGPGLGESYIKYKEVVFDLWRKGYSIYILDHRSQGFSDRPLARITANKKLSPDRRKKIHDTIYVERFDDYVEDLKIFVDTIVQPHSDRKLFLLAHSMGGAIGSLYLEKYPQDFSAAVFSSPMHQIVMNPLPSDACWFFRVLGPRAQYVLGNGAYVEMKQFDPDRALTSSRIRYNLLVRDEFRRFPSARPGGASWQWAYEACKGSKQSRISAALTKVPVLIFQAGADTLVTPQGQREFCDGVNSSHPNSCEIENIPGARHELLFESDRYRAPVLAKTLQFMADHSR